MAGGLGSLTVSLGLDAAEFIDGLTKSERQAQKFGAQLDRTIAAGVVKAEIAIRALGAAVRTTADVFQSLTTGAGQFKDLEETTGAAAESIAGLAVSAAVAGVDINDVAGATQKLTKNLVGVDDESKAAGAALKALNVNIDEFKKLDPVGQYEAVGKALSGYADGAGKVAVAQALFGKSGAEQLKVFKALEEAGGRQTILTQRQIELADAYADQQAKTTAELRLYAQAAASEAIPAFSDLTRVAADFARELLGIDEETKKLSANNGAKAFAEGLADAFAFAADQVDLFVRLFQLSGKAIAGYIAVVAALGRGSLSEARAAGKAAEEDINRVIDRATFAERLAKQRASAGLTGERADAFSDPRSTLFGSAKKPSISFEGAARGQKEAKDAKDKVTEADRYLESLRKQLQGTVDLTAAEKLLDDIQSGRLGKIGIVQQEVLLGIAEEIDATKEAQRVSRERADARTKEYEQFAEAIREQEQAERDRLKALTQNTSSEVFKRQQADIDFLRQAWEDGKISVEDYGEAVRIVMGLSAKDIEKANDAARDLGLTFASAFEDAIVEGKRLSDVINALIKDIARIVIRRTLTEPLANGITGLLGGSGGIASLFGGGKAIGGSTMPNMVYPIAENRPEVYSDGSRSWLITGSQRGNVDPNPRMSGGRSQVNNISINVPGNVDRRTAVQIGAEAARAVARANARNN